MKTFLAFGAAAAALILAPAAASAQAYAPSRVVKSVTMKDMRAVIESLGHTVAEENAVGDNSISARDDNGIIYVLVGTACDRNNIPGCQGVMMQVRYSENSAVTLDRVARANMEQAAVSTWIDPDTGKYGFTRYVVLDYGITMANLRENVNVLLQVYPLAKATASGED